MGFEDTLRERLMELPIPEATTGQLRAMRDRVATRERRHKHRRRSAVWVSVAAAVLVAGGAAYAWRADVLHQQPVRSQAAVPKPSDVQVNFWPVAPGVNVQSEGPPPQQFEVSVSRWPKGFTNQVVMAMVSINPTDQCFIEGVDKVDNSSAGVDGGPLSWQNAINEWLRRNNLSNKITQVADPNATNQYGLSDSKFLIDLGDTRKPFNPQSYRLVVMDVEDMGGQMYEVKWAKVSRPLIPHSFPDAVKLNLPAGSTDVKTLWQTSRGGSSYGFFEYQRDGKTYLIGTNGEQFHGYWSVSPDLIGQDSSVLKYLDFETYSSDVGSQGGTVTHVYAGTATMPGAARVKITWSDGMVDNVPIKNDGFGDLRITDASNKGYNTIVSSAVVLSETNQPLNTEAAHVGPTK